MDWPLCLKIAFLIALAGIVVYFLLAVSVLVVEMFDLRDD